jgi:hypothetical protein
VAMGTSGAQAETPRWASRSSSKTARTSLVGRLRQVHLVAPTAAKTASNPQPNADSVKYAMLLIF